MAVRRGVPAVLAAAATAALVGCSSPVAEISAQDPIFEGLDEEEVREALDLKGEWISSQPADRRKEIAQDAVLELSACRSIWRYLAGWESTGVQPMHLELPEPTEGALAAALGDPQRERTPFSAGFDSFSADSKDSLVSFITSEGTCLWMPVERGSGGAALHQVAAERYGTE
jgi:hypothetical protein